METDQGRERLRDRHTDRQTDPGTDREAGIHGEIVRRKSGIVGR